MPDNRRTIQPSALLELGDINGLLHELNGQQPVDNTRQKAKDGVNDGSGTARVKKADRVNKKVKAEKQEKSQPAKDKQETHIRDNACDNPPSSSRNGEGAKASFDAWEEILSIYSGYNHIVNRKYDSVIWIEKDIITTLQSCLGQESGKIVNSILLWFIKTYKSRLREMQSSRSPLL